MIGIAINIHTEDIYIVYRCSGSKKIKYLNRDKPFVGYWDINSELFIITDERFGV